jgi:hypothetical protein
VRLATATVLAGLVAMAGCGGDDEPAPAPPELTTVEVGPALDAQLTTAFDAQERRREASFAGVLPGDFPADLPRYEPSTLADFGGDDRGRRTVVLLTPDPPARVRGTMLQRLGAQGWACSPAGADAVACGKAGRSVEVGWSDARPGTRIRVAY